MKSIDQFIDNVKMGVLSKKTPIEIDSMSLSVMSARMECTKRGMWAIVDLKWTKQLAKWIGKRKCLEVMAGTGWLAKALNYHGIDIIATDDFSWKDKQHKDANIVYPVENIEGKESIKKYRERDILIISWPPYDKEEICNICDEWGNDKPIIYIGEGFEGCCAPKLFWDNFEEKENEINIKIPQWFGIHDYLSIGYWTRQVSNKHIGTAIEQLEICE